MRFNFSVDELVIIVSALRAEYRRCCEGAIIARKWSVASTDETARDFLEMARSFDVRCAECTDLYKKIIDKNIVEDL